MLSVTDIGEAICQLLVDLEITAEPITNHEQDIRWCEGIDSMSFTILVCAIEDKFDIRLDVVELKENDLRINAIASLIAKEMELTT